TLRRSCLWPAALMVSRRLNRDASRLPDARRPLMTPFEHSRASRVAIAFLALLPAASCSRVPPSQKAPLTQQRPLAGLLQTAAYPNSDVVLVLATMQQFTASHREWEGYEYFGRLAQEQRPRAAFFRSLQAVMQ